MLRKLVFLSAMGLLLTLLSPVQAQDNVLWNFWFGGSINDQVESLQADGRYPYGPDLIEYSTDFTADKPDKDYYGGRGRAYLTPPETGDYTIWVWSDDDSLVYLSKDEDPANAELVASVAGWTSANEWTKYATQKGTPKPLVAGNRYYLEGIYADGTGGGNIGVGWTGPGIGDAPTIIKGQYLTAFVETRFPAYSPDPANGAQNVTSPLFQWAVGVGAVMHDVYLGTDPALGADTFKGRQGFNLYYHMDTLIPGAKYYWRVDEVAADGTVSAGDVWTFTVMPVKAFNLSPYDGAVCRNLDTKLGWSAGNMAESHDVYLGSDKALVEAGDASVFVGNQVDVGFDPNGLAASTTFYWRVDEVQGDGTKIAGDVLSFTTTSEGVHGAAGEAWLNIGGTAITDLTNNARYPASPDLVQITPDFETPTDAADNYGARLRAWVSVPVAGDYTFWVASDDASELWLGDAAWTAVKIAQVDGWTASRAWDWYGSQKSASIHLEVGKYFLMGLVKEGGGGDNLAAAWQGPAVPQRELIIGGFIEPFVPLWAECVSPADGAGDVPYLTQLTWKAGVKAAAHNVYLGTDKNAVANATPATAGIYKGQVTETTFVPAALAWNKTYYWRVDEVNDAETDSPWKGPVWSFSVPDYVPLITAAETLNYDNRAEPFVSEAVFDVGVLKDFTVGGVTSLQLEVKGDTFAYSGSPNGTFTMKAAGADVWGAADEFRYAYKPLTGDGSIVARVTSVGTGSSTWAKAGVMIRATLEAGAPHRIMALTGGDGGGIAFQGRQTAGGNSSSLNGDVTAAAPYWVKLTREGNSVTGFYSADGVEWKAMADTSPDNSGFPITNPQDIEMPETVFIGLFATSHAAGELRTFTFDNVAAAGGVSGEWQIADVGVAQGGNAPAALYVEFTDGTGTKAVLHPGNPDVVTNPNWSTWKILLSGVSGVNFKAVTQVAIGVGDGKADGKGSIQFRNVRLVKPIAVNVVNPSFESPGSRDKFFYWPPDQARSLVSLPGWSTDAATSNAGFVKDAEPTKGSWSGYLSSGGYALFQLTDYTIIEGEVFQLDVDALVILGGVQDALKNLKMALYYVDDAGKRVTIGSASSTLPYDPQPRSLTVSASSVRGCIGRKIGIEFSNTRTMNPNVIGVDNVRLNVK